MDAEGGSDLVRVEALGGVAHAVDAVVCRPEVLRHLHERSKCNVFFLNRAIKVALKNHGMCNLLALCMRCSIHFSLGSGGSKAPSVPSRERTCES